MKKNRDVERPFVIDGIKEYDNPLPSWWQLLFYGSIVYGVIYLIYVHGFGQAQLMDELSQDRQSYQEYMADLDKNRDNDPEKLEERVRAQAMIDEGKTIYSTNCAACHGALGEGLVGPNLTDNYWIHGGKAIDLVTVITEGVAAKGMVPWQGILSPTQIEQVTAFVISLRGSNPPNPKAPQGELYEEN